MAQIDRVLVCRRSNDATSEQKAALAPMNTIHRINNALAQILALLNVAAAVVVVLISAGAGYMWFGSFGFFAGALLGTAAAAVLCGLAGPAD